MKRTIFLYGLSLAALIVALKLLEFRFMVHSLSLEIYLSTIAVLFTAFGVWAGLKLTRPKTVLVPQTTYQFDTKRLETLGISKREYEVLELMAKGLSNQEIADTLFVSLNTIKTHSSNLFLKLDSKRRTQAIQRAKEIGLLP
ncbi:DNA-binding response regulator [Spirosoma sp. BT702]|uniref:DNA-binding response regulator n=1 Tax=Spirosoma profusum TaxID=2771354 RepID=A0A927ATX1_9BACT|nr:LuxR C-terminal-related transcriptional regulator [Spirosoma profusum]MBD2701322.1 DNA-binding response regulator [Spirosoma profusum]